MESNDRISKNKLRRKMRGQPMQATQKPIQTQVQQEPGTQPVQMVQQQFYQNQMPIQPGSRPTNSYQSFQGFVGQNPTLIQVPISQQPISSHQLLPGARLLSSSTGQSPIYTSDHTLGRPIAQNQITMNDLESLRNAWQNIDQNSAGTPQTSQDNQNLGSAKKSSKASKRKMRKKQKFLSQNSNSAGIVEKTPSEIEIERILDLQKRAEDDPMARFELEIINEEKEMTSTQLQELEKISRKLSHIDQNPSQDRKMSFLSDENSLDEELNPGLVRQGTGQSKEIRMKNLDINVSDTRFNQPTVGRSARPSMIEMSPQIKILHETTKILKDKERLKGTGFKYFNQTQTNFPNKKPGPSQDKNGLTGASTVSQMENQSQKLLNQDLPQYKDFDKELEKIRSVLRMNVNRKVTQGTVQAFLVESDLKKHNYLFSKMNEAQMMDPFNEEITTMIDKEIEKRSHSFQYEESTESEHMSAGGGGGMNNSFASKHSRQTYRASLDPSHYRYDASPFGNNLLANEDFLPEEQLTAVQLGKILDKNESRLYQLSNENMLQMEQSLLAMDDYENIDNRQEHELTKKKIQLLLGNLSEREIMATSSGLQGNHIPLKDDKFTDTSSGATPGSPTKTSPRTSKTMTNYQPSQMILSEFETFVNEYFSKEMEYNQLIKQISQDPSMNSFIRQILYNRNIPLEIKDELERLMEHQHNTLSSQNKEIDYEAEREMQYQQDKHLMAEEMINIQRKTQSQQLERLQEDIQKFTGSDILIREDIDRIQGTLQSHLSRLENCLCYGKLIITSYPISNIPFPDLKQQYKKHCGALEDRYFEKEFNDIYKALSLNKLRFIETFAIVDKDLNISLYKSMDMKDRIEGIREVEKIELVKLGINMSFEKKKKVYGGYEFIKLVIFNEETKSRVVNIIGIIQSQLYKWEKIFKISKDLNYHDKSILKIQEQIQNDQRAEQHQKMQKSGHNKGVRLDNLKTIIQNQKNDTRKGPLGEKFTNLDLQDLEDNIMKQLETNKEQLSSVGIDTGEVQNSKSVDEQVKKFKTLPKEQLLHMVQNLINNTGGSQNDKSSQLTQLSIFKNKIESFEFIRSYKILHTGQVFTGQKDRFVMVSQDLKELIWKDPNSLKKQGSVKLKNVKEIINGRKTKGFQKLSKNPTKKEVKRSFSIRTKNLELDLVAQTEEEKNEFMFALIQLLQIYTQVRDEIDILQSQVDDKKQK